MSTPARRPGGGLSRRDREGRAFKLVVATGAGAVATVVSFVLAVVGIVSLGIVFLLAVLTAVAAFLLRRTMSN
ncbi:MAG: hypothetical protein WD844_01095 [Thermoleophilaceae bacterium]